MRTKYKTWPYFPKTQSLFFSHETVPDVSCVAFKGQLVVMVFDLWSYHNFVLIIQQGQIINQFHTQFKHYQSVSMVLLITITRWRFYRCYLGTGTDWDHEAPKCASTVRAQFRVTLDPCRIFDFSTSGAIKGPKLTQRGLSHSLLFFQHIINCHFIVSVVSKWRVTGKGHFSGQLDSAGASSPGPLPGSAPAPDDPIRTYKRNDNGVWQQI